MIMSCKHSILALLLLAVAVPSLVYAGEPTDKIKQTTDKILAIVQNPALQGPAKTAERQKRMRLSVDERFDWAAMARSAFGNKWRNLSAAQRAEFTSLFSELIENAYMSKVEGYSGEKILYKGDKVDGAYGVVDVMIVTLRGTDIPVSYRVLKKGTEWLVYDVSIEGVSLVNNYRNQISAILNSSSYSELIAKIKTQIDAPPAPAGTKARAKTKTADAPR